MLRDWVFLLANTLSIVCFARLLLQWGKLSFHHPLAQFCLHSTNWLVRPLRRIAPPLGRWDSACILAALLLDYLAVTLSYFITFPGGTISWRTAAANVLLAVLYALQAFAWTLLIGLIMRAWLLLTRRRVSVLRVVLDRVYWPLTRPLAFLRVGQVDLSGCVLAVVIWAWLAIVLPSLILRINLMFLHL